MPFEFNRIRSANFGVSLDTDAGEVHRIVPCDQSVQEALVEMVASTREVTNEAQGTITEFSPAEKYGANELLRLSLASELATKYRDIFAAENFDTDVHGLDDAGALVSYFGVFRDRNNSKLMGFRRAAQFKGVIKKRLVSVIDDSLRLAPDRLFKLDTDFDFLIYDDQILIHHPSSFVFASEMDEQIAAFAAGNVDAISAEIPCVDFSGLGDFVQSHKRAMRLVAALKSRDDLAGITLRRLKACCKENNVGFSVRKGVLTPEEGSEMDFLLLLDRRLYTLTLIDDRPETYQAMSRNPASR